MSKQPFFSIVIPIHNMKNGAEFLWNSINKLTEQTFQDFEIIITKDGKMAENTNSGIKKARGKWIKILYLDDCFSSEFSLEDIHLHCTDETDWIITGCNTNPHPQWTNDIETGNNKLGSPSVLTFRNRFEDNQLFDEKMSWLLDCDLYRRLYNLFGEPKLMDAKNVLIGQGSHQMTHILTDEEKIAEHNYMIKKYEKPYYV